MKFQDRAIRSSSSVVRQKQNEIYYRLFLSKSSNKVAERNIYMQNRELKPRHRDLIQDALTHNTIEAPAIKKPNYFTISQSVSNYTLFILYYTLLHFSLLCVPQPWIYMKYIRGTNCVMQLACRIAYSLTTYLY